MMANPLMSFAFLGISFIRISGHFWDTRLALLIEAPTEFQNGFRLSLHPKSFEKK